MKEIVKNYYITEDGKVWSDHIQGYMKSCLHRDGYEQLSINGKSFLIHRLVAQAYIPNPNNYREINHIDGNKLNNNVSNLEWCSRSHNVKHAFDTGLKRNKKGAENPLSKTVYQWTLDGELVKVWYCLEDAIKYYSKDNKRAGVGVGDCARGRNHTAYGYIFTYESTIPPERIHDAKYNKQCIKVVGTNIHTKESKIYESVRDTEKEGFIPTLVVKCCKGKRKTHKEHTWKYL